VSGGAFGVEGLDGLRAPVSSAEALANWAAASQNRNVISLVGGGGPGGEPMVPNRLYTQRRKQGRPVGIDTGEMLQGLTAPGGVNIKATLDGGEATVFAGPGSTDMKVNLFIRGHPEEVIGKSAKMKNGHEKKWRRNIPAVPGRNFIGVSQEDVDAAAKFASESMLRQLGFRQGG
jgi:hypothetical protein